MGIKALGFDEIRRRAQNFRRIAEAHSPSHPFGEGLLEADMFLENNPLAPIVGTICDQQITAEDAWAFPHWLSKEVGKRDLSAKVVQSLGTARIRELLSSFMESRWPTGMSGVDQEGYLRNMSTYIIDACSLICLQYAGDPDNMFRDGEFTVPEVYFILRVLPGVGPKKASMIARDFAKGDGLWYKGIHRRLAKQGINLRVKQKHLSEVPVDIHVVKVFGRIMSEFRGVPQRERFLDYWPDIQNFAKLAFPDFPGRVDEMLWTVGREYCHSSQPDCKECPLKAVPCQYPPSS